jgi:OOP family OmpA-OmpF porin
MKTGFIRVIAVFGLTCGLAMLPASAAEVVLEEDVITTTATQVMLVKTADNFIIMYDSSSSMDENYGDSGMTEIAAELDILSQKNRTLPNLNWQGGIYSHTPGLGSLKSFATYLPMQPYDKEKFAAAIDALPAKPSGPTLLQGGLQGLGDVLDGLNGRTVVFLFTDGKSTVQKGLPAAVEIANQLSSKHDVCFAVISSATGAAEKKLLNAVAASKTCSTVIPFGQLLHRPEWMTNVLFKVVRVVVDDVDVMDRVTGFQVNDVLFDFDMSEIKPDYAGELDQLAAFMQKTPKAQIILAGFTDSTGDVVYNMALSERRANSVRDYLVEHGLDSNRIALSWFGESDPVAGNDSKEGQSKNRRVTSIVIGL